ncbi:MAG: protein kinase domain-containing protein [Thermoanaerobaculia bacterium]
MKQRGRNAVVLVVDDDPLSTMLLTPLLRQIEVDVLTASTGEQALELLQRADLILLDISLPGMDGHEVAARARAEHGTNAPPIVFITTHKESAEKARAFESGASDYITKPFDFEEVRLRIKNQLRLLNLRDELESRNRELQQQNEELSRAIQQIQEKEEQLSSSRRDLILTEQHLMDSRRSVDRIFSTLSEILPGTVLDNRYKLESLIGTGGFGSVYRARHLILDRPVAVKVLQPPRGADAEEQLARFRAEAMFAYRFNHPNAVSVLDASVSSSGLPYIVMEFLEGWSLREELENSGRLTLKRCAEIIVPVCDVISRAHKSGMSHRDIKPDNIFVDLTSGAEIVKVLDFGLATLHVPSESSPTPGRSARYVSGTPAYMAPETFTGAPSDASKIDLYAIAVVTFELLSGQLPFPIGPGGVPALIAQHLSTAAPAIGTLVPGISKGVENLLLGGLEKSPDLRPTVRAFGEQLIIATLSSDEPLTEEEQATLRLKPLDED